MAKRNLRLSLDQHAFRDEAKQENFVGNGQILAAEF